MTVYPVAYAQDPPEKRNRLTVLLRYFMVIPHSIWAFFYGIAFFFALVGAWFAMVFTGRYPRGLYDFCAGFLRFYMRVLAYSMLVVDRFPPFDGGDHPEYPVQIRVAPPQETYSRLKAFFRVLLAIPIYIVQYAMQIWVFAVAIAVWFVGVFAGRTSHGLMDAMRIPMAYITRANGYFFLITETWPPFDEPAWIEPPPSRVSLDRPEAL